MNPKLEAAQRSYHGVDWSCPQPPLPIAFRPSSVIRAPREQQARVHHAFWDPRFVFWEYAICRGVRLFFFDLTKLKSARNVQRLGRFSTPPPGFSVNRGSMRMVQSALVRSEKWSTGTNGGK